MHFLVKAKRNTELKQLISKLFISEVRPYKI